MKVEAVIFDKDGTLVDFDAFWVPVAVENCKIPVKLARDGMDVEL